MDSPRAERTESGKGSSRCTCCFTDKHRKVGIVLFDCRIVGKDELSAMQSQLGVTRREKVDAPCAGRRRARVRAQDANLAQRW